MRTQNQHFSPGGDTFTAKELPNLSYLISQWSSRGFQKFYESGAFDDMVGAVKKGCLGTISVKSRGMIRLSDNPGNVSLGQIKKILEQLPEKRWKDFYFSFVSWTFTVGWWEDEGGANRPVDWLLRDEWREEMGLERINPIRPFGPHGKFVVFLSLGHSAVPAGAPAGYRIASIEELKTIDLPGKLPINVFAEGKWRFVIKRDGKFSPEGTLGSEVADSVSFFRNNVVFVPLVKL
jgi:hypothetical protein